MPRPISRLFVLALLGAMAGAVGMALAFAINPALSLEMDRDLPRVARGFHPPEQYKDETFAWTSARASLSLRGLNRRAAWACSIRVRGARPPGVPRATVSIGVDGVTRAMVHPTGRLEDVTVRLPERSSPGVLLTIDTNPPFVPGPADPRELGVQVDRVECRPVGGPLGGVAWPPGRAWLVAVLSAAAFAAALAWLNLPMWGGLTATLLFAGVQSVALAKGLAPYSDPYLDLVPWLTFWISLVMASSVALATRWRGSTLSVAASAAIAFSAGALIVELLALLHPSKLVVDAVFHAHRLQWVLGGRYFFTQPMPSGVQFPYAIALYVIAAPWSALTNDYVALLKIVVGVSRALAGLLLYPMVARAWGRNSVASLAVVLFHLVPLPFTVIGNANLTYAFGQSMGVAALAVAASCRLGARDVAQLAGLVAIASLAFLSHVGLFPLLLAILVALAVLYRWLGGASMRAPARNVLVGILLATMVSVISYYGRFWESYRTLASVRSRPAAVAPRATPGAGDAETASAPRAQRVGVGERAREVRAIGLALDAYGWALLLLTLGGAWRLTVEGVRDRAGLLLVACGAGCVLFVGFSVLMPVEAAFERYTDEFISRVYYAVMPAVVVVAARGAVWGWEAGIAMRAASLVLVLAAVISASRAWLAWLS